MKLTLNILGSNQANLSCSLLPFPPSTFNTERPRAIHCGEGQWGVEPSTGDALGFPPSLNPQWGLGKSFNLKKASKYLLVRVRGNLIAELSLFRDLKVLMIGKGS